GVDGFFGAWIANMPGMLGFYAIFMLINIVIVMGGVSGGIEKFSKIAMPCLAAIMVIVIVFVACQPGAGAGYKFLFVPDFGVLASDFFNVLKTAAGQMFFSLSLGMGCMITYGSYLAKKEDLASNSVIIPVADTIVALMAGMAVMPACAAYGLEYGAGPGLLFNSMQTVFLQGMGGTIGNIMGFLFYFLVLIAAITSSISLLEVCCAFLIDKRIDKGQDPARKKMTIIMAVIAFIVGLPTALDGLGTNIAGGAWMNNPAEMFGLPVMAATADWLDFYDFLAEGVLMPLGAMIMSILIGWVFGTKMVAEECEACGKPFKAYKYFDVCFKYIVPVIMAIVLYAQVTSFLG
ncbi:MAG: sodium-dependent transporter, partial [Clostridia bacterium]|nr:sodium-dependent transporter [Clostridia bacterium]